MRLNIIFLFLFGVTVSFKLSSIDQRTQLTRGYRHTTTRINASKNDENKDLFRELFKISEIFGQITSFGRNQATKKSAKSASKMLSIKEVANKIKEEYTNIFWATGNMDLSLWQENCTFADPFTSFGGPGSSKRFKANADNLGRFVLEPSMKITSFQVDGNVVSVGWIFKGYLNLPWRPVLAAAGETFHVLNPSTLLIEDYKETWKSAPLDVIKRLFIPGKQSKL